AGQDALALQQDRLERWLDVASLESGVLGEGNRLGSLESALEPRSAVGKSATPELGQMCEGDQRAVPFSRPVDRSVKPAPEERGRPDAKDGLHRVTGRRAVPQRFVQLGVRGARRIADTNLDLRRRTRRHEEREKTERDAPHPYAPAPGRRGETKSQTMTAQTPPIADVSSA